MRLLSGPLGRKEVAHPCQASSPPITVYGSGCPFFATSSVMVYWPNDFLCSAIFRVYSSDIHIKIVGTPGVRNR